MSSSHSKDEFEKHKPSSVLNLLRQSSIKSASNGKRNSISSQVIRTLAKLTGGAYDIEWRGLKLRIYPNENFDDKSLFRIGEHPEWEDFQYLEDLYTGKKLNIIDIGGNIGTYALFFWQILDKDSAILSFEPSPITFEKLQTNLDFNKADNIAAINVGIGEKNETSWLYQVNQRNIGENTLVPDDETGQKMEIQIRKLADELNKQDMSHIDVLKIDIEGYEDRALLPYLENCPPAGLPLHIMIEDNRHKWLTDCFQVLEEKGYELAEKIGENRHYRLHERRAPDHAEVS